MDLKDNHIEWFTGDDRMTVTLTQRKFINRVLNLAKKYGDQVEIVAENTDGSLCAHLPVKALHLMIYGSNTGGFSGVQDTLEDEEEFEEEDEL